LAIFNQTSTMSGTKEQKIAILIPLTTSDKTLILNGIKIASIFRKELCLVFHCKKRDTKKRAVFKQKSEEYLVTIKKEIPSLKTSKLIITGPVQEMPDLLADDFETILLIADAQRYSQLAKAVTESPVPFLFVDTAKSPSGFKKIIQPLDLRKENTDSSLWCSWFGRFNGSEIISVAANDKDKDDLKQVAQNVVLAKKLFSKFNITHKIYKGRKSSLGNSFEALELAKSSGSDLFVVLGSSVITPLDRLIGLPEKKIIRQSEGLPVLLVNPRRDNYILCD
jgi:hypothetical protein